MSILCAALFLLQPDTTPPAAVTNLTIGAVTSTSVVLNWTAPGDDGTTGTAVAYDIRYSTVGPIDEPAWAAATQVTGEPAPAIAGTAQSMTVTGLVGSTTYHFALKTRDEVPNWSAISNSPNATTSVSSDTVPPAAVTNLAIAGSAPGEVTVQWTAPGDDGATGTAAAYDLRRSSVAIVTDADFAAATAITTGVPAPAAAGTLQFAIVPLGGLTNYWIALKTRDEENNWSPLSNVVTNVLPPGSGSDDDDDKQGIPHRCGSVGADMLLLPLAMWLLLRKRR